MLLSAHEIAQGREHALNNLLDLTNAWVNAGHRLAAAWTEASRENIESGGRRLAQFDAVTLPAAPAALPADLWRESAARASRLLDDALEIFGETQKAAIRSAEEQVRILDALAVASINRARKTSPWEADVALSAVRATLQGVEQTLRGLSEAAIGTVDLAGKEIHQVAATLATGGRSD